MWKKHRWFNVRFKHIICILVSSTFIQQLSVYTYVVEFYYWDSFDFRNVEF